jgi:dihydroxyacetone kinase-like predicted kinase
MILIPKYQMEFILHGHGLTCQKIKNSLAEFGEALEVSDCQDTLTAGNNFKVCITSEDPTVIFDLCAQFGRIKSAKVNEIK